LEHELWEPVQLEPAVGTGAVQHNKTTKMMAEMMELGSVAAKYRSRSAGGLTATEQIKVQCKEHEEKAGGRNHWGGPAD
jgi:hypothetical protein